MTVDEAKAEARSTGSALRGAYEGLTQAPGAAGQIPGYQDTYPGQTSYYTNPEAMQSDGAVAGWNSEAYQTANSTTRPTVDVTRGDLSRATAIEADPNAYLDGMSADGSTGSCTPLPPGSGTANTAEWTCHVGSSVMEQPRTCTRSLSVAEWNETLYQYLCVTGSGFDGCASLAGNAMCRRTASYPVPEYGLTVDYYDCDSPVSDQELSEAKSFLMGSFPLRLDSTAKLAQVLAQVEYYGLGFEYFSQYPKWIERVTKDDVQRVAKQYLDPQRYALVVVGNVAKAKVRQ